MQDLKISLIQAELHWESVTANLSMFEEMIWGIKDPTDVIILPEMFSTGFTMHPETVAEPHNFNTFKWMKQIADQKKCLVIGSCVIKDGESYYNRLYAIKPRGEYHTYDKKHLFRMAGEDTSYSPGTERLIFDWKGWKICPMICYDLRFPVWARNKMSSNNTSTDYDLLLYVANWPVPRIEAWDTLLKARAIENQCYVAGVNRVGKDGNGYDFNGHSTVLDYGGKVMAYNAEEIKVINATLNHQNMLDFQQKLPFLKDADEFSIL